MKCSAEKITGKVNDHLHCNASPHKISQQQNSRKMCFAFYWQCNLNLNIHYKRTSSAKLWSRMVTGCPFSVCDAPSRFCNRPNAQDNTPPVALFPVSFCMSEIKNESMISLGGKLTLILEAARFCDLYNCLSDSARRFPENSAEESNLSERRVC